MIFSNIFLMQGLSEYIAELQIMQQGMITFYDIEYTSKIIVE